MQRLRQEISTLENDRSLRPAEPGGGIGGCSVVSILLLLAAVAVVVYGFIVLNSGDGGMVLLGLLIIAGGGYATFWCFAMTVGFIASDSEHKTDRKREIKKYDERPARIAELKRQLAQLEAKFR